jgi:hypothetical protein
LDIGEIGDDRCGDLGEDFFGPASFAGNGNFLVGVFFATQWGIMDLSGSANLRY